MFAVMGQAQLAAVTHISSGNLHRAEVCEVVQCSALPACWVWIWKIGANVCKAGGKLP